MGSCFVSVDGHGPHVQVVASHTAYRNWELMQARVAVDTNRD